jgi:2-amino-4-hydroxy-6-hydroxymethyldihydropteridine diphosphokinase
LPELAFVLLGSNISPERNLPKALHALGGLGRLIRVSWVYQSPAVGSQPAPDFLNLAALLETDLPAPDIRRRLREVEAAHARRRGADKFAPRTLDIDLCLLGDAVLDSSDLILPDPDILTHAHVAVPLADLAPDFRHPVTGETLRAIAGRLRPGSALRERTDVGERLRLEGFPVVSPGRRSR